MTGSAADVERGGTGLDGRERVEQVAVERLERELVEESLRIGLGDGVIARTKLIGPHWTTALCFERAHE